MAPRTLRVLTATLAVVLLTPTAAVADGDPASDVLLTQNIFFSYDPPVSPGLQRTLSAEIAAANRARFPLKVALIRSPLDLGVITDLYGKPQNYADFLGQEISLQYKGPLLVVMPAGYGVHRVSAAARGAVSALQKPADGQINDLARAAIAAVAKIAAASGHPIGTSARPSTRGSSWPVLVSVLAGAAVVAAAALVISRRRRAAGDPSS